MNTQFTKDLQSEAKYMTTKLTKDLQSEVYEHSSPKTCRVKYMNTQFTKDLQSEAKYMIHSSPKTCRVKSMNTQLTKDLQREAKYMTTTQLTKDLQSEVHLILARRIGGQTGIHSSVLHVCIDDLQCSVVVAHAKVSVRPV